MRMRRKKNLEERLYQCGDMILYMDRDDRNFCNKQEKSLFDFSKIFGNDKPLILEIGCGKGQFAIEFSKQNPQYNILAIEKSSNVVVEAAENAINEKVENLRFARGNAEYLDCFIPENSVSGIYLNFSCPFPKKSYASHRLTHSNFLCIYKKLLRDGAGIFQKTDNMHFFEFSIEHFSSQNFRLENVSLDLHNSGFEGNIETEYEQKFSSQGMPIYRLEAYVNGK